MTNDKNRSGQSLIEVIIGLAIGAMLIGAAVLAIAFALRSGALNQKYQIASGFNKEMLDKTRAVAGANWNVLYGLSKGQNESQYYYVPDGALSFILGTKESNVEGTIYISFFYVQNICRSDGGEIRGVTDGDGSENGNNNNNACDEAGGYDDPSTQKISIYTKWPTGSSVAELKVVDYITRWQNAVFEQTDWSGGADELRGPITYTDNKYASSTNITTSTAGSIKIEGF